MHRLLVGTFAVFVGSVGAQMPHEQENYDESAVKVLTTADDFTNKDL